MWIYFGVCAVFGRCKSEPRCRAPLFSVVVDVAASGAGNEREEMDWGGKGKFVGNEMTDL